MLSKFNIKYKLGLQLKKPNDNSISSSCKKTPPENLNSFTKNSTFTCAAKYISISEYHKNCYTEYVPYCKSEIIALKKKARTVGTRNNNKCKINCSISEMENKTSQYPYSKKIIKDPSVTSTCKKTESNTNNDQCKKSNSIDKISSHYNLNIKFSKNFLMDMFTKNYNYIKQLKSIRLNDVNRETQ